MNCGKCKFWAIDYRPNNKGVADCSFVDSLDADKVPKDRSIKIDVETDDDSGLRVEMMTGCNFGCIHFQPKKSKEKTQSD